MSKFNKFFFAFNFVIVFVIATVVIVYAWTNPSQNPPDGAGVISIVNNNVGIGAPTPESWAKLDVHTIPPNQGMHLWNSAEGGLLLGYQGSTIQGRTPGDGNGDLILQKFGGNVGIGVIDPGSARLNSVTGEGNAGSFTNTSPATYAALIVQNTGGGWGIYDGSSGKHYLFGNLGIGASPVSGKKLYVAGDAQITGSLDMSGQKIINLAQPALSTDAATKSYVDSVGGGGPKTCQIIRSSLGYASGSNTYTYANCPANYKVLAGGGMCGGPPTQTNMLESCPINITSSTLCILSDDIPPIDANGWIIGCSGSPANRFAFAICCPQ